MKRESNLKARILLVEDHVVLRQGLKALFADMPDLEIVGESGDGYEALRLVSELQPDLVLMDISLPGLNGIETTRQIQHHHPQVKVVVLSMHANEEYVFQMLQAGASGYVLKQADSAEVLLAIRAALIGDSFLSPQISNTVISEYLRRVGTRSPSPAHPLTPREQEVLQLLADGFSNHEIARQLNISVKTVESHRSNLMNKLGLANKTELVKYAMRQGWIMLYRNQDENRTFS